MNKYVRLQTNTMKINCLCDVLEFLQFNGTRCFVSVTPDVAFEAARRHSERSVARPSFRCRVGPHLAGLSGTCRASCGRRGRSSSLVICVVAGTGPFQDCAPVVVAWRSFSSISEGGSRL